MDIEIIENQQQLPFINDIKLEDCYKTLKESFLWVNNPQGEKRIKQDISNILTDAYQQGQTNTQIELNKKIDRLNMIILELRGKYEPKEEQSRGYGEGRYQGD